MSIQINTGRLMQAASRSDWEFGCKLLLLRIAGIREASAADWKTPITAEELARLKVGDPARHLSPGRNPSPGQKPEDVLAFKIHYCRPHRPEVMQAWRDAAAWYAEQGLDQPSVHTWYRIERSLPVTVKFRGRMTGAAFKAVLPFVSRDVSMFKANDIWVGDGHTFKAKVQHPIHGQAFRPEVTLVVDWKSRKAVGWSVDMAESTIAVSAALRDAQLRTRARPLIYYRDNGSGQTGKSIDCPDHGTLARQGIAGETGIPGSHVVRRAASPGSPFPRSNAAGAGTHSICRRIAAQIRPTR